MSHQEVMVKRESVAPCMTCPLCHKLFRDATTVIECLHTFCRKCIYKKLSDEEMECCPICNIDLGCVPLEKLRADHNLQDVRSKIFPSKRIKMIPPEMAAPVSVPAKRKERSLSSLVVSTPRVSAQSGMTGRRSKSIARKASKGSSFTAEKSVKKEGDSAEEQYESSSSPEMANKSAVNTRQSSVSSEHSNVPNGDMMKENGSEALGDKADLWKPLDFLVEAASRSKLSKSSFKVPKPKTETSHSQDNEAVLGKVKNKELRQKSKTPDEKNHSDHTIPDTEMAKKPQKVRQKKARKSREYKFPPQRVLDASSSKHDLRFHPIWFSLISDVHISDTPPLPQISASYLRIKDGSMPVSLIQKYLSTKLDLSNDDEIEIKCMGQTVTPTLTLNKLLDRWLQTSAPGKLSAAISSSAKDFVMVLFYSRRTPNS